MKKRVRKKKRLGEFQEFGFKTGFCFSDQLSVESRNNLLNRFIEIAIEKNGLQFGGGGGGNEWHGFVTLDNSRGSTLVKHRQAVEIWFILESEISEYYLTDMIDAWYGDLDDVEIVWVGK
jgi:uncharacterized protein YggL (DUF469 family)